MGSIYNKLNHKVDFLALSRLKVQDENGNDIVVSSLWKTKPIIMIFVRHFGCIACRAHVDQIWNKRKDLRKTSNIIFIGNGKPEIIKIFKEDVDALDAVILTDPSLKVFDACGFKRSPLNLIDPRGVKRGVGLTMEGYKQGAVLDGRTGAHTQMGGVIAFKPPGAVVYHFVSDYLGDFDKPEDWPVDN
jgi:hypothetical protein